MTNDEKALKLRITTMLPELNERQRRLYLAAEAKAIGYGGVTRVSKISGVSRVTISQGVNELEESDTSDTEIVLCRRRGGGRKPVELKQPGIKETLANMVEAHTCGDPRALLLWTSKSVRNLSAGLTEKGYTASHVLVSTLLKDMAAVLHLPTRVIIRGYEADKFFP